MEKQTEQAQTEKIQIEDYQKSIKKTLYWILFILILIGAMIVSKDFNLINQSTIGNTKQFEYKIEYFDGINCENGLNNLGESGWKVVGSRRATSSGVYGYEFILMKEK